MSLGEYVDFDVTSESVHTLVENVIVRARSYEFGTAYAQLAPAGASDACASGVSLYCTMVPVFRFAIRLDETLAYAAHVEQIAAGHSIEHRGDSPRTSCWQVTLTSPSDPIGKILYQILREICGCGDGELTYVYYPDPVYWEEM